MAGGGRTVPVLAHAGRAVAGGASRGVMQPLLAEQPTQLVIANRTASKAMDLALRCGDLGRVSGCDFSDLAGRLTWKGDAAAMQRSLRDEW